MSDPNSNDPTLPTSQAPTASSPGAAPATPRSLPHLAAGAVISRYRIESGLGEGGMGVVYLARQGRPDREVALKVVRPGYATDKMLRRFEHESEVLGKLLHPGIAQIYEAGTADAGFGPQPFFAMELVRGVSLTRYATQKNLSTRERLELMAKVCDAVQHAHQKGVIHRDLKPGNILVTDDGQPKILDFGVARATDSDMQQTTQHTDVGAIVGTLPYMSPEQVGGDPAELDTRSDVYALGVILYELLAGRLPYSLESRMIHEAARIIREEEPTRLSSIDRTLRGDVETIVAHALEKDKARRYGAASALGADLRRYLNHEPIAARPASTWYQLARFSRRNRALVGGVIATFAVLVLGVLGMAWQASIARGERDAADAARVRAEAISDFVTDSLQSSDPTQGGAQAMTVAQAMSQALANLDRGDLRDQPQTEADLLWTIAHILQGNGLVTEAELPAKRSLEIQRRLHSGDHFDVAVGLNLLASIRQALGRMDEAEPLYEEALAMQRRLHPGDHVDVACSLNNLAFSRDAVGRTAEAETLYVEALAMYQRLLPGDDAHLASALSNVAAVRAERGDAAGAEPLYRQAMEMRERLFAGDHPDVATSLNNVGHVLGLLGREPEAQSLYERALNMRRRIFRGDHPDVADSLNNLAFVQDELGHAGEAQTLYQEALAMYMRLYPGDHPEVARTMSNLAFECDILDQPEGAEHLYTAALEMRRRIYRGDHQEVADSLANLAVCLDTQGRQIEALVLAREGAEMSQRILIDGHPTRVHCDKTLADIESRIMGDTGEVGESAGSSNR